jgi:hypothetical protein
VIFWEILKKIPLEVYGVSVGLWGLVLYGLWRQGQKERSR